MPAPPNFGGQRQQQILRFPEFLEIFIKEAVFPVVDGCSPSEMGKYISGKHGLSGLRHVF
jgi:hypothetical protein